MVMIQDLEVSAGLAANHLVRITRRVCSCARKARDYFRKRKRPAKAGKCPYVHQTGPWLVDTHEMRSSGASATGTPAETFPFFALLPPELRLRIWHFASTSERIVELLAMDSEQQGFRSGAAPRAPAVLSASRESRSVARAIYKPWFWTEEGAAKKKPIHINPVDDLVFLRNSRYLPTPASWDWAVGPRSTWRRQLRKLQRVAFVCDHDPMDLTVSGGGGGGADWLCVRTAGQFRGLRELVLVWVLDGAGPRTFQGRGANVFADERGGSLCHSCSCSEETRRLAEQSRDRIFSTWVSNGVWTRLGREPPVITIMHWCTRDAEVWI